MTANLPTELVIWQKQAHTYLIEGNYTQAANLYEQAIQQEEETKSHYWYLGLLLLLQEQEAEAQTTWLLGMAEGEPEQVELWTVELIEVLQTEAERRRELGDYLVAWAIRQHIREIVPIDINNLLHLIGLSVLLETYTGEELNSLGAIDILQSSQPIGVDFQLLMQVLKTVLDYAPSLPSSLELATACLAHVEQPDVFREILARTAVEIAHSLLMPKIALPFAELALSLDDKNLVILQILTTLYQNAGQYDRGIAIAQVAHSLSPNLSEKVFTNHQLMRGLMSAGGYWEEVRAVSDRHLSLLESLVAEQSSMLNSFTVQNLFLTSFFLPYIQDRPQGNRKIQNQVSQLCQTNVEIYAREQAEKYRQRQSPTKSLHTADKPLKIGYLSHCLCRHSVGWLARWLFQHHDRERFQIYIYFMLPRKTPDSLQEWYINQVDNNNYKTGVSSREMAEEIYQDEIDILIDLDSITIDLTCEVLSLKPAPIQVTWLGWDASGLPAIDYFIADPYVLPESAQHYYSEKIWRLPETYIAVDGFEVGVPTLRRDELNIPSDAVVYLSAQKSYKRHPDTARLQIKILAEVPNSYFLIKGSADEEAIKNFFFQLAEEEGVECDRLRFLPEVAAEAVHRANLGIADVVLDTYPYNGATTTLETLWMCIPLVTRVGEQFAARNSYTMMMNAGVIEGIAWTDEEYIEWGIRLGKDASLREKIAWKLRQSRQTAPLWNAKQFTREMEKAYEQMWEIYRRSC